jgi:hypothetical protein
VTHLQHLACHTRSVPSTQPYLPTLYKARKVPTKQVVCAICVERTRGRTKELNMGYGVTIWLCEGHASHAFQTQRSGRDLVLTLQRLWRAHGCLTAARHKALRAHLTALEGPSARPHPGSYTWPTLRTEAEHHFAAGAPAANVITALRARHAADTARAPSVRTMRRWFAERRWLGRPP